MDIGGDAPGGEMTDEVVRRRLEYARRLGASRSPAQRLADFARLQQAAFAELRASADGYRHFLQRNYGSRRVEVIDGQLRPVSPD